MIYSEKQLIDRKTCLDWITHNDQALQRSTVGEGVENLNVRRSEICFKNRNHASSDYITHAIMQVLEHFVSQANEGYAFDISPIPEFQFTKYTQEEAGGYGWHNDGNIIPEQHPSYFQRKLSAVLCLNDYGVNYKGGELVIETENKGEISELKLEAGDAVVFPSFYRHKVNPIKEGVRYSIVCWIRGPKWR